MGKQIPFKMRNVYDLDDYYVLEQNGWKLPSNNTLKGYKKQQLIEIVRMLEHNWAGKIKANMLQNKRLENFYNYYKEKGQEELFSKIIDEENNEENTKLINQQKAFIKWLEDYINLFDKKDIYEEGSCDMLEEILQKYEEIIGDDK